MCVSIARRVTLTNNLAGTNKIVLLGAFMIGFVFPRTANSMAILFQRLATALFLSVLLPLSLAAQMVSPEIDSQPGPFSYFSKPTDELGVFHAPSGTEVTPEGYLYTGFGELIFL
jgi:hypothetical protein